MFKCSNCSGPKGLFGKIKWGGAQRPRRGTLQHKKIRTLSFSKITEHLNIRYIYIYKILLLLLLNNNLRTPRTGQPIVPQQKPRLEQMEHSQQIKHLRGTLSPPCFSTPQHLQNPPKPRTESSPKRLTTPVYCVTMEYTRNARVDSVFLGGA